MEIIAGLYNIGLLTASVAAGSLLTVLTLVALVRTPDRYIKGRWSARFHLNLGFLKFWYSRRKDG